MAVQLWQKRTQVVKKPDESDQKIITGLKRWGVGNKPQNSRAYARDPLAHVPPSHFLIP